MGECSHCTHETPALGDDDAAAAVLFDEEVGHRETRHRHDQGEEQTEEERIHLRSNCLGHDDDDDEEARGSESSRRTETLCPPAFCVRTNLASSTSAGEGR